MVAGLTVGLTSCDSEEKTPSPEPVPEPTPTPEPEKTITDNLNLYDASTGSRQEGKINVRFSPNGKNPSFQIEDSYKITDKKDQQAILEYIMASEYYSKEVYCRTLDSMLIEWDTHNDIHWWTKHERVAHTDFDKNDEGVGYWEFYWRGLKEALG